MRRLATIVSVVALAVFGISSAVHAAPSTPDATRTPAGVRAAKGAPPDVDAPPGQPSASASTASTFLYASAYQRATVDGASAWFRVAKPYLASADYHSLAELAVQSADGRQIVEVGWTVDRQVNGDALPRLFVFHWVNGVETCYNGCGFVPTSSTIRPGHAFAVGSSHRFTIQQYLGNWWIGVDSEWVGYFPSELWNGGFTKGGLVQWFGEVSASSASPCTDMGTGTFSADTGAASITHMSLIGGPAVNIRTFATHPSLYTVTATTTASIRYGGPGAC